MAYKLVKKLLLKSNDSFLLSLELYNKPTINYRAESFSLLFSNAWELLLKAYLLQKSDNKKLSIFRKKKKFIKNVLLGFAKSPNKEKFELERIQDALLKISAEALELLIFIKKEILPILKESVKNEMTHYKPNILEEKERLLDITWQRQSISQGIMKWIYDRYNINSPQVKKQYKAGPEHNPILSEKIAAIEHKITKEKTECWPELLGLGIFRINVSGGVIGSAAGSSYNLTEFGFRFLEYIDNS